MNTHQRLNQNKNNRYIIIIKCHRKKLCQECMIAPLEDRRNAHLLSSMHKQTIDTQVLKKKGVNTRFIQNIFLIISTMSVG